MHVAEKKSQIGRIATGYRVELGLELFLLLVFIFLLISINEFQSYYPYLFEFIVGQYWLNKREEATTTT